jgi:Domain of unknown function (DUF4863)
MSARIHSSQESFMQLIATITGVIAHRSLDQRLEQDLNTFFPAHGERYQALASACECAIRDGWMCSREAAGIKYGRVIKPGSVTHGFSVDVVEMEPVEGPYHRHPNGEINLIMPLAAEAQFDGHCSGWLVYGSGSAHQPTVTGGIARVLYLLPDGAIEFTRT